MNEIYIEGRLGKDPEVAERQSQKGTFKTAKFSVAVDRDFGDETDWFPCEAVGTKAENIGKYFVKGKEILLCGHMESYKVKDSDVKRWQLKVEKFWFVGGKSQSTSGTEKSTSEPAPDGFEDIDEDVPF